MKLSKSQRKLYHRYSRTTKFTTPLFKLFFRHLTTDEIKLNIILAKLNLLISLVYKHFIQTFDSCHVLKEFDIKAVTLASDQWTRQYHNVIWCLDNTNIKL